MDILSCPVLSSPPPKRKRENDTGSPLFFPVVLGGGVTGYLSRASNGVIKQSMAGSKGRVFLLLGSFLDPSSSSSFADRLPDQRGSDCGKIEDPFSSLLFRSLI